MVMTVIVIVRMIVTVVSMRGTALQRAVIKRVVVSMLSHAV